MQYFHKNNSKRQIIFLTVAILFNLMLIAALFVKSANMQIGISKLCRQLTNFTFKITHRQVFLPVFFVNFASWTSLRLNNVIASWPRLSRKAQSQSCSYASFCGRRGSDIGLIPTDCQGIPTLFYANIAPASSLTAVFGMVMRAANDGPYPKQTPPFGRRK